MNIVSNILTDPLIALTIRWVLAAIFAIAVMHKLRSSAEFHGVVQAYRLVPAQVSVALAHVLIVLELLVVGGLVLNQDAGSILAAGLLSLYATGMLINLLRGRFDLDCGCGGWRARQKISPALVVRNSGLAALALYSLVPVEQSRTLTWIDWFTALSTIATVGLIWLAAGQLFNLRSMDRSR